MMVSSVCKGQVRWGVANRPKRWTGICDKCGTSLNDWVSIITGTHNFETYNDTHFSTDDHKEGE